MVLSFSFWVFRRDVHWEELTKLLEGALNMHHVTQSDGRSAQMQYLFPLFTLFSLYCHGGCQCFRKWLYATFLLYL